MEKRGRTPATQGTRSGGRTLTKTVFIPDVCPRPGSSNRKRATTASAQHAGIPGFGELHRPWTRTTGAACPATPDAKGGRSCKTLRALSASTVPQFVRVFRRFLSSRHQFSVRRRKMQVGIHENRVIFEVKFPGIAGTDGFFESRGARGETAGTCGRKSTKVAARAARQKCGECSGNVTADSRLSKASSEQKQGSLPYVEKPRQAMRTVFFPQ